MNTERIELETLQREKNDEAAECAMQIRLSGLRLRVVELETQLGKAHSVNATNSEAKHGFASGGAPFIFCSSAGIKFILLPLLVQPKILLSLSG